MTDTPRPPTPLETAQQRLETAERATLHARPDLLIADLEACGLLGYDEENAYLLIPMG